MVIEVSAAIIISIISLSFSIYMGLKGNKRTDTKDIEARAQERAEINAKLNHIATTTQEIKEQISSLVKKVEAHSDRLTKMEENLKSVWKRIDIIEKKLDKEGDE